MADPTIESLAGELATANAKLALAARTESDLAAATKERDEVKAALAAAQDAVKKTAEEKEATVTKTQAEATEKVIKAELKAAFVAAGIIDFKDALAHVDMSALKLDANGELVDGAAQAEALKKAKPYLFKDGSSTTKTAAPKAPAEPGIKNAADLTPEEWKAKRRELGLSR